MNSISSMVGLPPIAFPAQHCVENLGARVLANIIKAGGVIQVQGVFLAGSQLPTPRTPWVLL